MKTTTPKRYWRIRGHNGLKTFFDKTVGLGQFTEKQIQDLLRALAAKAGLDFNEIVGAYATRRTKIANKFLDVHRDPVYGTYMCGSDPHFTAMVVDGNGKRIPPPDWFLEMMGKAEKGNL